MIHEFAVQPEVAATWEQFRVLWPGFGVGEGRFLVEYPGKWRKRVYELADTLSRPVHAHSIKSKLGDPTLRRAKLVGASGREFDGGDWLANAIRQQAGEKPFRAIVARTNSINRPDVLPASDFDTDSEPWHIVRQKAIRRNAEEICAAAAPLLRHSDEVVLVDPYFNLSQAKYKRPFKGFVGMRRQWKRLEIHKSVKASVQGWDCKQLGSFIPQGTTLTVLLWPDFPDSDEMHARYILTERGGIGYDWGLDEGKNPAQTTEVRLVEHERYLQLRKQYNRDSRAFGAPDCIEIKGNG